MDKTKDIVMFLRTSGRASTARIAAAIKANQWMAERYLEALMKEGRVRRKEETRATYWELA